MKIITWLLLLDSAEDAVEKIKVIKFDLIF